MTVTPDEFEAAGGGLNVSEHAAESPLVGVSVHDEPLGKLPAVVEKPTVPVGTCVAPAEEDPARAAGSAPGETLEFGTGCHSGGTIELFIDPILPPTQLVVIGDSPVAVALAGLAPRVGLPVTVIARGGDPRRFADARQFIDSDEPSMVAGRVAAGGWVVVATQGRRDLPGLQVALSLQAAKIWLVASARKARALRAALLAANCDSQAVSAIIAPAGQPIGAQTPEEIALSVLAAVVAARRTGGAALEAATPAECCGH